MAVIQAQMRVPSCWTSRGSQGVVKAQQRLKIGLLAVVNGAAKRETQRSRSALSLSARRLMSVLSRIEGRSARDCMGHRAYGTRDGTLRRDLPLTTGGSRGDTVGR